MGPTALRMSNAMLREGRPSSIDAGKVLRAPGKPLNSQGRISRHPHDWEIDQRTLANSYWERGSEVLSFRTKCRACNWVWEQNPDKDTTSYGLTSFKLLIYKSLDAEKRKTSEIRPDEAAAKPDSLVSEVPAAIVHGVTGGG